MFSFIREQATPMDIYLSKSNHHLLGKLRCSNAQYHGQLLDISEVTISVDKYVNQKINTYYDSLLPYMEIYIPSIGWFRINEPPEESIDYTTGQTKKTFTAMSYETQLQDMMLTTFYINAGIPLSMEMFEENLDALGVPKRNIRFYIDDPVDDKTDADYWQLGLLNIIEREYLSEKGWSIGHVDTELKSLRGRKFEIDNQDVYSFLTQVACQSYKCVFIFDTFEKTVNAYQVDNLGKSLNIEMSRRNFLNSVNITAQEDTLYTRCYVTGGNDETTIAYVNFGSSYIENLSYLMEYQVDTETAEKYATYISYKETRREDYANTIKQYLTIQQKIDIINNRVPIDECSTSWDSYTTEALEKELSQFQSLLQVLIDAHTVNGVLQIENTADYETYLSIKDVIIPSIQAVLDARESGEAVQSIDWQVNWDLYGIVELKNKKTQYQNSAQLLADKGYDKPWDSSSGTSEITHNQQYQQYLKYQQYIQEIDAKLASLQADVDELEAQKTITEQQRDQIVTDVQIENERFGFTEEELSDINNLYYDIDFNDSSIEIQSLDDIDTVISISKELLVSAQKDLAIRSRPQTRYTIDLENFFRFFKFKSLTDLLELGDFMYLDLDDSRFQTENSQSKTYGEYLQAHSSTTSYSGDFSRSSSALYTSSKIKQRLIGFTLELVDLSDTNLELEFSDMVRYNGLASDNEYLIGGSSGSRGSGLSASASNYFSTAASSIALSVLENYLNGGSSLFPNGISAEDAYKLAEILNGLIDGNLTLDELKVKLAQIDELEANSAFIKYLNAQYLVANQADFQQLHAQVAEIDEALIGKLDADYANITFATITDLNALNASIGNLDAEFGEFVELTTNNFTAVNGSITNLDADYANIKTLLSGNAGIGDLQNIHLTSENAVIETALIKDLISQNITVNDLLAGKISTNKFEVGSDNGAISIKGATQQWRDKNGVVRMQAGMDATGDFTFSLFDESGEGILIDSTGIHEGAIADGLLVNDMIAENAGISASKLDIHSLFTEINESGEYIYANKIFYDEAGQTLDVAFTQMSNTLTVVNESVQNAQDTAQAAQDTAQAAMDAIGGISSMDSISAVLSNDSHVVHTNTDGSGGDYSSCKATVYVFLGEADVSNKASYSISTSTGVKGIWDEKTRTYHVTNLTTDSGYVDISILYGTEDALLTTKSGQTFLCKDGTALVVRANGTRMTKRFSVSKSRDGRPGVSYNLECSSLVIRKQMDDTFSPTFLTLSAKYNNGTTIIPYAGRFKIEETVDFQVYITRYISSIDELNTDFIPTNADIKAIRCTLYKSGGTTEYLDSQNIIVITDADGLADEVDTVKEMVYTTASHVTELETSVEGVKASISDVQSDIYGLSDNTLLFNVTYQDNGNGTTTLNAVVYKDGKDVTKTYPYTWFSWDKKSEAGRTHVGQGYSITVQNEDSGLGGATYVGSFATRTQSYLCTKSGQRLVTKSNKYILAEKEA